MKIVGARPRAYPMSVAKSDIDDKSMKDSVSRRCGQARGRAPTIIFYNHFPVINF